MCERCGHFHMTLGACPHCEAATNAFDWTHGPDGVRAPQPGDFTLCSSCGEFAVVTDERKLRVPTAEEQVWIDDQPPAKRMRVARQWRRQRANRAMS